MTRLTLHHKFRPYIEACINSGSKDLELRPGYRHIQKIQEGDVVQLGGLDVVITSKKAFESIEEAVTEQTWQRLIPEPPSDFHGVVPSPFPRTRDDAVRALQHVFPNPNDEYYLFGIELPNQ